MSLRTAGLALIILVTLNSHGHAALDTKAAEKEAYAVSSTMAQPETDKRDAAARRKKYRDDEILVKFKEGVSEEKKQGLHKKHGAEKLKEFPELRLHHVKLRKGMSVEEGVKAYRNDPGVEYAEPNFIYTVQGVPGDPRFSELWGLNNTGQTGGTAGADIKATAAWDITTGSSDVVVVVIDTGIDYTHPDLAGNMWVNVGIDTANQDSDPFDDNGHGTHVAGTIGAVGNNAAGVSGVNWNVRLTACKFLGANGSGTTDAAVGCLQYIKGLKDAGANIVATNNSWGGGEYSQALYDAINAQRSILFIAAAGNNGVNTDGAANYPAGYDLPNVIAVAATDHNDNKAAFSNYGIRSAHVSAPGVKILSTLPAANEWGIAGGYGLLSGTSMATPHVTGLAALIKAQNPGRDWIGIKNLILSAGDTASNLFGRTITGRRINAHNSLACSGEKVLSPLKYPATITVGTPVTLSALSLDCEAPSGPVTVNLSGGEVVTLADDGAAPDLAAGDGVFAATWTPVRTLERLRFSSPAGAETIEYPPLQVATAALPTAYTNKQYRHSFQAGGGYFPYTWSVLWGSLPQGITLNGSTGELSGSAASPGSYHFTLQMVDGYGAKAVKDFSLNVNTAGTVEAWSRTAYSNGFIIIYVDYDVGNVADIAVDGGGNSYVTRFGYAEDAQGVLRRCFYVVKYDSAGNELWTDTSVSGDPRSIVAAPDGFVYVGGSSPTMDQYLLAKYDPDGNVVWTRQRTTNIGGHDIAADAQGNVYITGDAAPGYLTVKFDSAGNEIWARTAQVSGKLIWSPHMATDSAGNIYITGHSESSADPNIDIILVKYDPAGNQLWAKAFDNGGKEAGQDVIPDNAGNFYVTGWTIGSPSTLFLNKFDAGGNLVWNRSYPEAFGTKGLGLARDSDGNIIVAGNIQGTPYAATDFLTLTYDSAGTLLSAVGFDGGGTERGERVAVSPKGDLHVTGSNANWTGALTIKYDLSSPVTFAAPAGATYDLPQTVTLSADEPATIRYTLDGSIPTADSPVYTGPLAITAFTTLRYFATDTAGHVEAVKTETYQILPQATVTGVPTDPTNAVAATLTVGGAGVVAYRFGMDGGEYSVEFPVTTPIAISGLAEGAHTVAVIGRDTDGNWQRTPTTAAWTIDLTPPEAVVIGSPVTSADTVLAIGGSGVTAYRYALDGGAWGAEAPVTTKIILSALTEGTHNIEGIGRDSVGNWQVVPTVFSWTVDGWPVSLPSGDSFRTFADAYAFLPGDDVIQLKAIGLFADLVFARDLAVILRGGYDTASGSSTGSTAIYGSIEIRQGTVTVENLVLLPPPG